MTLDGTLDMGSVFGAKMTVTSGLTLNGTILLGSADGSDVGTLTAQGTQTWSGTGSILFGGSDTTSLAISSGATLTLGAGLTVHGQSGEITGTFINQGTISADLAGRTAGSTADEDLTSSARVGSIRGRCKSITEPRSSPPVPGPTPAR